MSGRKSDKKLISIILLLDGYKTVGEGAHKKLVKYPYRQFDMYEISLINELRVIRNKIAYDGFFVTENYLKRNISLIKNIISKLKKLAEEKLPI